MKAEHESRKLVGCYEKTPSARFKTLRIKLPERSAVDAERLEESGCQIVDDAHSRQLFDYGAAHICVFTYIAPAVAGLECPFCVEEILDPSVLCFVAEKADVLTRRHCKKMENSHLLKRFVIFLGSVFRKNIDNLCVEGNKTFINRKAHRNRSEALADRIHGVRCLRIKGMSVCLKGNLTLADKHHGMNLDAASVEVVNERSYFMGADSHLLGEFRPRNDFAFSDSHKQASFIYFRYDFDIFMIQLYHDTSENKIVSQKFF